jgi:hypothetical protein
MFAKQGFYHLNYSASQIFEKSFLILMVISELWLSTIIIIVITHIRIFLKVHQTEKLKCKYFTSVLVYYNKIYFKNKKIKI